MFPKTLYRYFAHVYLVRFGVVLAFVVSALLLANSFDVLSRFRGTNFTLFLFLKLISFKLPYLLVEILPLIIFITTLVFYNFLVQSHEIVIVFNSGVSIWKMLLLILSIVLIIGLSVTFLIQPLSSMLLGSYERLEARILKKNTSVLMVSESGVIISEDYEGEKRFITAGSIDIPNNRIYDITILIADENNNFINRIDAKDAYVIDEKIILNHVKIFNNVIPEEREILDIPTNLTISRFVENLAPPEGISFWDLKVKIRNLESAGMPSLKYKLYYYKLYFRSLMMIALVLLATCFTVKSHERNSGYRKIFIAIITGFTVFLLNEICVAILTYNGIAPMIAILGPILIIISLSVFSILHLHEIG